MSFGILIHVLVPILGTSWAPGIIAIFYFHPQRMYKLSPIKSIPLSSPRPDIDLWDLEPGKPSSLAWDLLTPIQEEVVVSGGCVVGVAISCDSGRNGKSGSSADYLYIPSGSSWEARLSSIAKIWRCFQKWKPYTICNQSKLFLEICFPLAEEE